MSYALQLQAHTTITDRTIVTPPASDIAGAQAALFLIKVYSLSKDAGLNIILQCFDLVSNEWFDFVAFDTLNEIGNHTYPSLKDPRFFQAIPSRFRAKCEVAGTVEFSIGYNTVS